MSSAVLTIVTFSPVVPLFILFFYVLSNLICKSYIQFEARIWHTFLSSSLILKLWRNSRSVYFILFLLFWRRISLCIPVWLEAHCVGLCGAPLPLSPGCWDCGCTSPWPFCYLLTILEILCCEQAIAPS